MFSVTQFGRMLTDGVRHAAHVEALRRLVRPGSTVIDIGTGTGVYALLAARLGAAHVYAIDPNPGVQLGRQHAIDNGLDDRVSFICGLSTELTLSQPADLIISDLRDTLPFNGRHFSSVLDARRRLLAPDGVMLPTRDVVRVAVLENEALRAEVCGPWGEPLDGLDLSAALEYETNQMRFGRVRAEGFLTEPITFADLDYGTETDLERPHHIDLTVPATRPGTAHGIGMWFDATVFEEIGYTTGPSGPPTVYRNAYLPLRDPIEVRSGDEIRVEISCRLNEHWDWTWRVSVGERRSSPWRQSTLRGVIVTDETVRAGEGRP